MEILPGDRERVPLSMSTVGGQQCGEITCKQHWEHGDCLEPLEAGVKVISKKLLWSATFAVGD